MGVLPAVGGILLWGTAFETIHSLGDVDADQAAGLRSLPVAIGRAASLRLIPVLHGVALDLLGVYAWGTGLGWPVYVALIGMAGVAGFIDRRLAERPHEIGLPFRTHFALGAMFLLGVVVALFVPGVRL